VAVPANHPFAERQEITAQELKSETMLLLGTGHCFRDHVLEVCPEFARFSSDAEGIRKSFEGSSLETIKHMVASGMGVTVVPALSVPKQARSVAGPPQDGPQPPGGQPSYSLGVGADSTHLRFIPFAPPAPTRRVVLAWRRTFTRYEAIAALRNAIYDCQLEGVTRLS
jgi:LysR family hydrogen peroxide-inducible transcriptional activator